MVVRSTIALLSLLAFACTPWPDERVATPVDTLSSAGLKPKDTGMEVKVEEVSELSSPTIGVLAFILDNKTSDFLHVEDVLVDFGLHRLRIASNALT